MVNLTVKEHGIHGYYQEAERPFDRKKAVIILGGSDGNDTVQIQTGALLCKAGISALGLCYWNRPGLHGELIHIPVEIVETAVRWLKEQGYRKIAVYAISKGSELALLAASLIPDITCVVALAPSHCVYAGLTGGSGSMLKKDMADASSWTWRGCPIPCMKGKMELGAVLWRLLTQRQFGTSFLYEKALDKLTEDAVIPVERIGGPILLLSPEQDTMWPSKHSCEQITQRLLENEFPYRFEHISYPYMSHIMVPIHSKESMKKLKMFRVERQFPEQCRQSREDAFAKAVDWLKAW